MAQDYNDFIDKFKRKRTTDDCYTPNNVYNVVLDYVIKEYKVDKNKVVRPFYLGGDYRNFDYSGGCVVVDNPPFSIFKEIKDFYVENDIPFFLFSPHLTLFGKNEKGLTYIVCDCDITYENGARVNTSFTTNLDREYAIKIVPELKKDIRQVQESERPKRERYQYPRNLITSALLAKYISRGLKLNFKADEIFPIRALDSQKKEKKKLYGTGFLISDEKAKVLEDFFKREYEESIKRWELSEREKEIIKKLGKREQRG